MSEVIPVNCGFPSVVIEEASTYLVIVWNKAIFIGLILRIALLCGSLALAFLDEAFQDCSIPAELFSKRNTSKADLLIGIKASKMGVPILRQWDKFANRISEIRALSAGSLTSDVGKKQLMGHSGT
jgi:hypothetical protein